MTTYLITGATSGIGRALASLLVGRGDHVIATARTDEKAGRLARDLASGAGELETLILDQASLQSLERFHSELERRPAPDISVLNAGVHIPYRRETTEDGLEIHEQVNFVSAAALGATLLRRHPKGTVAYVGSNAFRIARSGIRVGTGFWWRYAVSKHRAMVVFYALSRVFPDARVITISPGSVLTDVHRHKQGWVVRWNKRRGVYMSADTAAAEIASVLGDTASDGFYFDRRKPVEVHLDRELDGSLDELWAPVRPFLEHMGGPAELSLGHSRLTGGLTKPGIEPRTAQDVAELVGRARSSGTQVKVRGSRHSYNDCFVGPGANTSVDAMDDPPVVDAGAATARVGAGATVAALVAGLHRQGWTLPFSGNTGSQTIAGAVATGTHGYARVGGLMSELVESAEIIDGNGDLREIDDGDALSAARLGLGLTGIMTAMTIRVVPLGRHALYRVAKLPREEFWDRHESLARGSDHMRFFELHVDLDDYAVLTIDLRDTPGRATDDLAFVDRQVPMPSVLLGALRKTAQGRLGAAIIDRAPLERESSVPFSTNLFMKAGVSGSKGRWLARGVYTVLNNDRTYNMEIAVPVSRLRALIDHLERARLDARRKGDLEVYWTGRFCGANNAALLAPNRGRDTYFVDIHVTRESSGAVTFLESVQGFAIDQCEARLHWGKVIFGGPDRLLANYDPEAVKRFMQTRAHLDPEGVFANRFSRAHLGIG